MATSLLIASGSAFVADVTKEQVVEQYANVAHAVFSDALTTAKALDKSIESFKAALTKSLDQVKQAWIKSRVPYQQSEVFDLAIQ